jgi:hypothetical protein
MRLSPDIRVFPRGSRIDRNPCSAVGIASGAVVVRTRVWVCRPYSAVELCPNCSADQIVQEVIFFRCFIRD